MNIQMKQAYLTAALLFITLPLLAEVQLPIVISEHMVLQQSAKVPIWGRAEPGEEVSVTLNGQTAKTTAGTNKEWRVELDLKNSPQGPFEMVVQGENTITIPDVVVGEVWLASGQSNMYRQLSKTQGAEAEIAGSTNPMLRQFTGGHWRTAEPQTSGNFSGVAYYFGKTIQRELKVPVGIIHASMGSTTIEAWMSEEALDADPDLKALKDRAFAIARDYPENRAKFGKAFAEWIKANDREDKPTANPEAYAAEKVSADGWIPLVIKRPSSDAVIPATGAIWLRKEINIPTVDKTKPLRVDAPPSNTASFYRFYWNGKLIKDVDFAKFQADYPTLNEARVCEVPAELVKQGLNVLALRLYTPLGKPIRFRGVPKAGEIPIDGEWQAKVEYELPPLDRGDAPTAPELPPGLPPTCCYAGLIRRLEPYALRGVIWYQGESNTGRAWQYRTAFPLLIQDWRNRWKQGDIPFYFCQLANFGGHDENPPKNDSYAELREAQSLTLKVPNTGQAVLIDVGEAHNIHPANKKDPGERLAKIALAKDYGRKIPYSGPVYQSMKMEDGKIRVTFTNTDGGLIAKPLPETVTLDSEAGKVGPLPRHNPDGELEGFAICGEDQKWVWARAAIDGASVIVWSDKIAKPIAVRYAYAGNPTCNLYNGAGLPASPFRTDDFPAGTLGQKY